MSRGKGRDREKGKERGREATRRQTSFTCIRGGTRTATDFPYHSVLSCHPRSSHPATCSTDAVVPFLLPASLSLSLSLSRCRRPSPRSPILLGATMERLTRSSPRRYHPSPPVRARAPLPFLDALLPLSTAYIPLRWTKCVSPVAVYTAPTTVSLSPNPPSFSSCTVRRSVYPSTAQASLPPPPPVY